jgi:hypothetical protein
MFCAVEKGKRPGKLCQNNMVLQVLMSFWILGKLPTRTTRCDQESSVSPEINASDPQGQSVSPTAVEVVNGEKNNGDFCPITMPKGPSIG